MNYKVIVLGVQGINNKVYGPGEIVTEKHFPEGNAEKLVKDGKLEEVKLQEEPKLEEVKKNPVPANFAKGKKVEKTDEPVEE